MRHLNRKIWPYHVTLPLAGQAAQRERWLSSNTGTWSKDWYGVHYQTSVYYFKREEDMTLFLLRWANKDD